MDLFGYKLLYPLRKLEAAIKIQDTNRKIYPDPQIKINSL